MTFGELPVVELALAAGFGFGLFAGYYLGQRGGLGFVRQQLDLAGTTAEKMAQIMVAPYGVNPVQQNPSLQEDLFSDLTEDEERVPVWMEEEAESRRSLEDVSQETA